MIKHIKAVFAALLITFTLSSTAFEVPDTAASIQQQVHIINVNKANVDELVQLKGVGAVKAQAIVSYRESNGKFKSVDELLKVKGIGEKVIAANIEKLSI